MDDWARKNLFGSPESAPSAAEKAQSLEKVEAEDTEEQESEQFWMGALSDALASKQHVSGGQLRVVWFQVLFFDLVCVV